MELTPSYKHSKRVCDKYNGMMQERFATFYFHNPLPEQCRVMSWPKCGRCAAQFYLSRGRFGSEAGVAPAPPGPSAGNGMPAPIPQNMVAELEKLGQLHTNGVLDLEEFRAAKRHLLRA